MHANERSEIDEVRAGDIAAAVDLKDVTTGDSLTDPAEPDHARDDGFPRARHRRGDRAEDCGRPRELGEALRSSCARIRHCASTSMRSRAKRSLRGMGELHLEIVVDRMLREFGVVANVGRPQVAYRETIRNTVEQDGKFVQQAGGRDQYAQVSSAARAVAVEPRLRVRRGDRRRRLSADAVPAVDEGVRGQMAAGVIAGYPSPTSKSRCSAARTQGSTRARRPSSSPAPPLSRKACARRGRRCSSRS